MQHLAKALVIVASIAAASVMTELGHDATSAWLIVLAFALAM